MERYSDKFLNQTDKLKNAVIGFELEFYTKDLSYYKTLEILNTMLSPIRVHGFRIYHPDFKPTPTDFILTPDLSGGSNMIEIVTGPLDYYDAKYYLLKLLKFIQKYGYTNEKCSIHYNISFNGSKDLNDLNALRLILNTNEEEIYRAYPSRKNNVYAKSIKNIIPYKDYDFDNVQINIVQNNMRLPDDKYFGINFLNINNPKETQRLEYRYIGGKDYEKNPGQLLYFLDRFIINTFESINTGFNSKDTENLSNYLENNIKRYKSFSNYDSFLVQFPSVKIQIDQSNDYNIISTYYKTIYDKIYNLVESSNGLSECIINYVVGERKIEVVDANIKTIGTIREVDFIHCTLDGIFENCLIINSDISDSQLTKCKTIHCETVKSKVFNSKVEHGVLKECYFMNGYLNGDMIGGVFRSGELGPNGFLNSDVKIVTSKENFFDTKFDNSETSKLKNK